MHEVIGHASGKVDERLEGQPAARPQGAVTRRSRRRAPIWSRCTSCPIRSWSSSGVIGAADHADIVRAEYEAYTRNALVQLRRVREGTQIEEDHMRNRQMIVRWLMANTKAIETRVRDGKTYYVDGRRAGVSRRRRPAAGGSPAHQGEGDYAAAQALFETYGIHFDPDAARRDRRPRRRPQPAVVHRLRHAEAGGRQESPRARSRT